MLIKAGLPGSKNKKDLILKNKNKLIKAQSFIKGQIATPDEGDSAAHLLSRK